MTSSGSAPARALARHLVERDLAHASQPADIGAALEGTWTRVAEHLRRTVGDDGYMALLTRAVARAQPGEPVLNDLCRNETTAVHVDIPAAIDAHGTAAASATIVSLIASLVDVLGDLIGDDMARSLIDVPPSPDGNHWKSP
jgi:hypothetical protein